MNVLIFVMSAMRRCQVQGGPSGSIQTNNAGIGSITVCRSSSLTLNLIPGEATSSTLKSGHLLARLHNGAANGQPHAAALRLGGKERRKDLIHLLRWQTHAQCH